MTLSPGDITFLINEKNTTFSFINSYAILSIDNDGLRSDIKLALDPQQFIHVNTTLPNYHGKSLPIGSQSLQAVVITKLTDLTWLTILFPNVNKIKGTLNSHIDVDGTLVEATFDDGEVESGKPCASNLAELAMAMGAGNAYVNVHSLAHGHSEIRGNFPGGDDDDDDGGDDD